MLRYKKFTVSYVINRPLYVGKSVIHSYAVGNTTFVLSYS
jgi:hypothetical protein